MVSVKYEANKWGAGVDMETTVYSDGVKVEVTTDDSGVATLVYFPDGMTVESATDIDYTMVTYPDGSNKTFYDMGLMVYMGPYGSNEGFRVQCLDAPDYHIKVFFRYGSDGNMHRAYICNSDGSSNKWSGTIYDMFSVGFGFGSCFRVYCPSLDKECTFWAEDGPYYDY